MKWFLIVTAAAGALIGLYAKRVVHRRNVIAQLATIAPAASRTLVEYDYQFDAEGIPIPNASSSVPKPLPNLLGPSFFHEVIGVCLDGERITVTDLQTLRLLPNLTRLDVEYNTISSKSLETIGTLVSLERLDLQETGIGDNDLAHISSLRNLKILLLSGSGISDDGLSHLREMTNLKSVAFRGCSIHGSGLVHLRQVRSLRSLNLRQCPISNQSIDMLRGFQGLKELDLSGTKVTDAGIMKVVALRNLSQLRVPDAVSQETINFVRQELPNCEINRGY